MYGKITSIHIESLNLFLKNIVFLRWYIGKSLLEPEQTLVVEKIFYH